MSAVVIPLDYINKPDEFNGYPTSNETSTLLYLRVMKKCSLSASLRKFQLWHLLPEHSYTCHCQSSTCTRVSTHGCAYRVFFENSVDRIQFVPSDAYPFVSVIINAMLLGPMPLPVCPSHVHITDFT
jgi:hypothetical protein